MGVRPERIEQFIRLCNDGWLQGWHECHAGNLTCRLDKSDVELLNLNDKGVWSKLPEPLINLGGDYFLASGSGKSMRNASAYPEETIGIIEIDKHGEAYRIVWGLTGGGSPTSELPTHLKCQSLKKEITKGEQRIVYHAHPANIIALSFILPLSDEVFTRELWEMEPECGMIFSKGMGVLPWMVPGTKEIAEITCEKMKKYDVVLWAQHGLFVAGDTFDRVFGLMGTVEKGAEILVKVLSMSPIKRQTPSVQNFRDMDNVFELSLPEQFLYEKY